MISICIPCYAMQGKGLEMLCDLLLSIGAQEFPTIEREVIVADDGGLLNLMGGKLNEEWETIFRSTRYVQGKTGAAANLNAAIAQARGDIIKPMFQDDKFIELDSLTKINQTFSEGARWIACNSQNGGEPGMREDLFKPYIHDTIFRLAEGENTYGSPSAMAWRRCDLRFDENLHWLFDCEFYARMAERYGAPAFVDTPIFIRQWSGMATLTVANGGQRVADHNYVVEKYR